MLGSASHFHDRCVHLQIFERRTLRRDFPTGAELGRQDCLHKRPFPLPASCCIPFAVIRDICVEVSALALPLLPP